MSATAIVGLGSLEGTDFCCPHRESNHHTAGVQPVVFTVLRYSGVQPVVFTVLSYSGPLCYKQRLVFAEDTVVKTGATVRYVAHALKVTEQLVW